MRTGLEDKLYSPCTKRGRRKKCTVWGRIMSPNFFVKDHSKILERGKIMEEIFADLHVHIGRSENGKPIKITAARSLNFANIAKECADRKGINIVGIIDCASPYVIEDIENFLKTGDAYEIEDGGIIYKDKVCILLGSEVETSEVGRNGKCGAAHNVCFFPHLSDIKGFSKEMSRHIHNITLSTQRSDVSGYELIDIVEKYNGILIPAHCFTPFKSYYGNCVDRMKDIFKEKFDKICYNITNPT